MIPRLARTGRRAWELSARAYAGGPSGFGQFKRNARWATTSALREALSHRWFVFLERPELRPFLERNPRLAFAPMGAYLCAGWSWEDRIRVLQESYAFAALQGGALREALLSPGGVVLASWGPAGESMAVRMRSTPQFRKEGEWGVFLEQEGVEGAVIGFAFSLARRAAGGWALLIGAVQGRPDGGEGVTKSATKDLHGIMPKRFVVFLAQEIARSLRMRELLGAGNRVQIYRVRPGRRKVLLDYDGLWSDAGGTVREDGWFQLPLKAARRTAAEIKPNKRGMYQKRYAMQDLVARQIRTALTLPPDP